MHARPWLSESRRNLGSRERVKPARSASRSTATASPRPSPPLPSNPPTPSPSPQSSSTPRARISAGGRVMGDCLWCGRSFEARTDGGRAQRFCRPACRRAVDAPDRLHRQRRLPEIGQLEEVAPAMAPARRLGDRTGFAPSIVELAEPGIGIGLEDAGIAGEMPGAVLDAASSSTREPPPSTSSSPHGPNSSPPSSIQKRAHRNPAPIMRIAVGFRPSLAPRALARARPSLDQNPRQL